jgi:hypothetical protein
MNCEDPPNNSDVDRMLEMAYARTEEATAHRGYCKERRHKVLFGENDEGIAMKPDTKTIEV